MGSDQDSAWKDVLDEAIEEFILFFFPQIHGDVAWSKGFEHLDKELEPILRDAARGKRLADKLLKVHLLSGKSALVLIHVEVQGSAEAQFARRMFEYNTRIGERYGEEVVSLAILTDERASFRPSTYERSRWGFELRMKFPFVKLLDYEGRRTELEANKNPFALVVLAHLDARAVKGRGPETAFAAKWNLIRRLYSKGYERENVVRLFKFIDWVLRLPQEKEDELQNQVRSLEGKESMPYVANFERRARAEGKQEGLREGLREAITFGLKLRFGEPGLALVPSLSQVQDPKILRRLHKAVLTVKTLDQLRAKLPRD